MKGLKAIQLVRGVIVGGLVGTVMFAVGGALAPYVNGVGAGIFSAIGFVGGLALVVLDEMDDK